MSLKITLQEDPERTETEVMIHCRSAADPEVTRLLSALRPLARRLTSTKDSQTFPLLPSQILYIESVDHRTFFYCDDLVCETPLRLYELELCLSGAGFVRASKAVIVNLSQVRSLRPDFGGRLILTMNNGEKLFASRQYAKGIKENLGI